MTKTILTLFGFLIILYVNSTKAAEKSEVTEDRVETIKTNEDDNVSASLQIVHMDLINDKGDTIVKHNNEDNYSEEHKDVISTDGNQYSKSENLFENSSDFDEIIINPDDNIEELIIPSDTIRENDAEIEVVIEHITEAHDQNDNKQTNVTEVSKEDNSNWRSAENSHSGVKEDSVEEMNGAISPEEDEYSLEDYRDKKLGLNIMDRVEPRNPERQVHTAKRPYHVRNYGLPDHHSVMDPGPLRSLSEIMVPRLRPTLTRNGIMFTPTLFSIPQSGSPLLDRLSGRNWLQRIQVNPEREFFTKPQHHHVVSLPQYEDSKMIDDYNDYGTNAYSYVPGLKVTTPVPPRQIVAPNKFDIFKKLSEASNHPKLAQRTINDNMFSGNYYPQQQYSETYGPFDVRRFRRNTWNDEHFQDI